MKRSLLRAKVKPMSWDYKVGQHITLKEWQNPSSQSPKLQIKILSDFSQSQDVLFQSNSQTWRILEEIQVNQVSRKSNQAVILIGNPRSEQLVCFSNTFNKFCWPGIFVWGILVLGVFRIYDAERNLRSWRMMVSLWWNVRIVQRENSITWTWKFDTYIMYPEAFIVYTLIYVN